MERFAKFEGAGPNFGLIEQNGEEEALEKELFASAAPVSLLWLEKNNDKKLVSWNAEFEEYLSHRAKIISKDTKAYAPWNVMSDLDVQPINGYALNQGAAGTCAGAAFRNSLFASDLINAKFAGIDTVVETGVDIVYALARGNGRLAFGSGCNGTPLVKYGTEVGNYRTADMGPYDARGRNVTRDAMENNMFKAEALKHQSICCYVPEVDFGTFYTACSAGLSIWIGSPSFPSSGRYDSGLKKVVPKSWTSGAHATCFTYAADGLLYWQNSHGGRYAASTKDEYGTPASGCWITKDDFVRFRITKSYGTPFVHFGELVKL